MTCGMLCVMRRERRGVLHLDKYSPPKANLFEQKEGERKREIFIERDSTFSLNFPKIRPAVSSGARGRVQPHGKGFT